MLKLYDQNKNPLGYITKYTGLCIVSTLSSGDKELSFTYQANARASEICEEYYIETEDDFYVVKEVELSTSGYPKITCKLDLEGLESDSIENFSAEKTTLTVAANKAVSGTGWTAVVSTDITKKRTYVQDQWSTPYDILIGLTESWMCELYFDSKNKIVYFVEELGEDRGVFLTASLNLKKAQLSSDTYDYYTRIIPFGYDDLTISSVNGGKNYVENFQYSSKIRTLVWKNTNYTEADELLEDATKKLEEISKPVKSYNVDIADLARQSEKYSIMSFSLGDTVLLLDERTGIKDKQRIVKLTVYPRTPEKNKCELSSTVPSFTELTSNMKVATDTLSNVTNSSGSVDGNSVKYVVQGVTVDGVTGIEVIIENSDALAKAIELSEEYTNTTLTSYSTTSEMDSAISIAKDDIMSYVLENYSTTETIYTNISDALTTAEGYAEEYTSTRLESYSTTSEMNSAIDEKADSILLSVSQTYATTADVAETTSTILSDAEGYTDSYVATTLESYSTTTEMNTAISEMADSISLTVSQTYATTSSVETQVTEAIETAEGYTETYTSTVLENYSTTTEMQSAIDLAVDSIDLSVYAKTTTLNSQISSAKTYASNAASSALSDAQSYTDEAASTTLEEANEYSETYTESYVSASLVLKIEDGIGVMSGNADRIELTAGQLIITSGNLILDENGNATFSGTIEAAAGSVIGGWTISSTSIYRSSGSITCYLAGAGSTGSYFLAVRSGTSQTCVIYQNGNIYGQTITAADEFNGELNGNAATATQLQTGAVLEIGNYSRTLYGNDTNSFTLANIGAAAASHTHTDLNGYVKATSTSFLPVVDSTMVLGYTTYRWSAVYSVTGTIQTSDVNEKDHIVDINKTYENLFMKLRPCNYMWRNYQPGDHHDRVHCGLIAQEVEIACAEVGLDSMTFAALCRDDLDTPTYDGRTERYSINYGELHGLEIHMIQKNVHDIADLYEIIHDLREEVNLLTAELQYLKAAVA